MEGLMNMLCIKLWTCLHTHNHKELDLFLLADVVLQNQIFWWGKTTWSTVAGHFTHIFTISIFAT